MLQDPAEPILDVTQLAFSWRDKAVLHDIDLSLHVGRIVALLGPNGAGKSTLIRCICGRLQPDAGRIRVAGQDPIRQAAARAAIGLVPQQIALYPHLTVTENLRAFARLAGVSRQRLDAAVAETIAVCDLAEVAGRQVGKLSGGWQRRVNIASALCHAPRLLVLDEPTVGIDPPARADIERLLQRLAGRGLAILMTSHDLAQLEILADGVAFLVGGRIAANGSPSALIQERFGAALECRLQLATLPSSETAEALAALGLKDAEANALAWSGLVEKSLAAGLQARLPADAAVIEFRVRRPGLDTLWRHLYGSSPGVSS